MIRLAKEFVFRGYRHKQIAREGKFAVYQLISTDCPEPTHFETIIVQHHNGRELFGRMYPAAEYYPNSHLWGDAGWTHVDRDSALDKLRSLLKRPIPHPTPRCGARPKRTGASE